MLISRIHRCISSVNLNSSFLCVCVSEVTVKETDLNLCEKDDKVCVTDFRDCNPRPSTSILRESTHLVVLIIVGFYLVFQWLLSLQFVQKIKKL